MKTTYEAIGSVRGECGHQHRTIAGAERCRQRDADACGRLGGGAYSDREVRRTDGEPLTDREWVELDAAQAAMCGY
jgi:hypothetical protein